MGHLVELRLHTIRKPTLSKKKKRREDNNTPKLPMPKRQKADQSRVHTGLAHIRASDAIMRRLIDTIDGMEQP